jgi:hypothetical protein
MTSSDSCVTPFRSDPKARLHVHECIHRAQVTLLNRELEVFFPPTRCKWTKCTSEAFSTRCEAMKHLQYHLTKRNLSNRCKWDGCSDDLGDNCAHHMFESHGLYPYVDAQVKWCYICGNWWEIFLPRVLSIPHHSEPIVHRFPDRVGDGADWNDHCIAHFEDLFEAYVNRGEYESLEPCQGIEVIGEWAIYKIGEGLGGNRPEFHDAIIQKVIEVPAFCPYCVFDDSLEWDVRMKQYVVHSPYYLISMSQN